MRIIQAEKITSMVAALCIEAAHNLPPNQIKLLKRAASSEKGLPENLLKLILKNAETARKDLYPLCQDTGTAVVFLEIGQNVFIDGDVNKAVDAGVRKGFKEGYLRKSIVACPLFKRENTKDNTPAVLHISFVKGDKIKVKVLLKGGGAENTSRLKMFAPADGKKEISDFIIQTVKEAGAKACPPLTLGVGIGGDFEQCAFLAKKALTRKSKNRNKLYAAFEEELLSGVNALKIGPQGMGGKTTALAVYIETAPCHMASLPVAVNVCCHSHRFKEGEI